MIVDNASDDGTVSAVRAWAHENAGRLSFEEGLPGELSHASADLTLLLSPVNGGFAWATNRGLELLLGDKGLELFWILNPDCEVLPRTARTLIAAAGEGPFALMGGRTLYRDDPAIVQTDGGRVSLWTGVCRCINEDRPAADVALPGAAEINFLSGANCVASRQFIESAGLMPEDYFLYYEEVDWAMQRGALPLRPVANAEVMHRGGATIGSGTLNRRPSAFSNYFNYRNRIRFLRRFSPGALPVAYFYATAKACQLVLAGAFDEARGLMTGLLGLPPPRTVRRVLGPADHPGAFGPAKK